MYARLTDLLYEFLYWIFGMLMVFSHSFRVEGSRRIPKSGPVLLIANHQSYLDIVPLGLAARRRIFFLAKKPLFRNRILAGIMNLFDTVGIDSEGMSRAGLQGLLDHLERGDVALVFPEGERCWDGKLNELKPGISLLIRKAKKQAQVVPIGIAGAFEAWPRTRRLPRFAPPFLLWTRRRIAVVVGEPLDGQALAAMSRPEMMAALQVELQKVVSRAEKLHGV
jgi:1-acyl-sn-glycerol-3-phosphate acyltransferase